ACTNEDLEVIGHAWPGIAGGLVAESAGHGPHSNPAERRAARYVVHTRTAAWGLSSCRWSTRKPLIGHDESRLETPAVATRGIAVSVAWQQALPRSSTFRLRPEA